MIRPTFLITREVAPGGLTCAVKRLRPADIDRADLALRLDNERQVLTLLAGVPGVIRLLGVRSPPLSLLLEWCDGGSLDDRLRETSVTATQWRQFARELVEVVAGCHRLGVTHRDIKPSNLLFRDGRLRLADFGVAAWGVPRRALPEGWEEDEIGTPPWSAPELRHAAGGATSPAVDVYGVARTLDAVLRAGPSESSVPAALSEWIATALCEEADRRPALSELLGII